jgi:hypothetical protein
VLFNGDGWDDNIKMYLEEMMYEGVNCTLLAEDRNQCQAPMNTGLDLWIP